tara:strand:+ start:694 stop:2328 length:1635 start_codon:yes stop_codon:yes gene_type:complete
MSGGKKAADNQAEIMETMLDEAERNRDYFQPQFEAQQEVVDAEMQNFKDFEFTNPYADLENPYADIRTDFGNPSAGMGNVADSMTNVAADAIDPSAGMTNVAAGAQNMMANMQNQFAGMENSFAGLENQYEGMENAFEDATVDTRAAEFQAQQVAQQQANIMQGLRGAAGTSGIAALAQTMANQGQLASQQAAAGIAQQERQNQMLQMQEASRLQQLERGEAARLQSQAAQGAMSIQQQERAGAARVQEQIAAGAMSAQQQRIAGATQLQNLQFQGATEQQRQQLAGAQALQDAQLRGAMQLQNMQFQGEQWANEMNAAQENLIAQGAWTADVTAAQGAAAVQQAEFGQLSSILGMEMGQLAGLQSALTGAQGNVMAGYGSMAEMYGSQAAASSAMWGQAASTAASLGMMKLSFLCIPKGTKIDCVEDSIAIEDIKPGDTVIGYNGKPVKVMQKHEYLEDPTLKRFYKIKFNNGSIVDACDMHKIQGERAIDITKDVESKEVYDGVEFSYDLLTEDMGYRINGIPVNSMIAEMASEIVKTIKNK